MGHSLKCLPIYRNGGTFSRICGDNFNHIGMYYSRLITALGGDSDMIKGVMSTPPRNGGNGVIKIELQSIELKIRCLKNKESLRHTAEFKKVYIHSSKPNGERVSEMNFKTLLSVIPGGDQYRVTGRIIPKVQHEHMHRPDPQPDVRP